MTYVQLIVLSVLLGGVIDAVDIPARQSFLIQMVEEREDLPHDCAELQPHERGQATGSLPWPALIGWVGEGRRFSINGVSFLAVLIALLVMRVSTCSGARPPPFLSDGPSRRSRLCRGIHADRDVADTARVHQFRRVGLYRSAAIFATQILPRRRAHARISDGGLGVLAP